MKIDRLLGLLVAVLVVSGCDRNIEPYQAGEEPREPDLSRIFPAPEDEGPQPGQAPAGAPPSTRGQSSGAAGEPISGRIAIAEGLGAAPPQGAVLFIIARPEGVRGGPPLAVVRVADPRFPLDFEIGQRDIMMPNMRFDGPMQLTARLDSDGNALTKLPDELEASASRAFAPGTEGVELVLARGGGASPGGPAATPRAATMPGPGGASASVRGTIRLAPGRSGEEHAGSTLFVVARQAGAAGGPPLAVLRIPRPELPLEFEIGQGDVMIPGRTFAGEIVLTARLDSDGDAMTRPAGDPQGGLPAPVTPGTSGVELMLE